MDFEIQLDEAGSNLEPQPCNFEKLCIFIDLQMILVSFFEILSRFGVICKKTIFFYQSRPLTVQNGTKYMVSGLDFKRKIGLLQITPKRLKISKNDTNII